MKLSDFWATYDRGIDALKHYGIEKGTVATENIHHCLRQGPEGQAFFDIVIEREDGLWWLAMQARHQSNSVEIWYCPFCGCELGRKAGDEV